MHTLAGFASKVSTGSIAALPDENINNLCIMSLLFLIIAKTSQDQENYFSTTIVDEEQYLKRPGKSICCLDTDHSYEYIN